VHRLQDNKLISCVIYAYAEIEANAKLTLVEASKAGKTDELTQKATLKIAKANIIIQYPSSFVFFYLFLLLHIYIISMFIP